MANLQKMNEHQACGLTVFITGAVVMSIAVDPLFALGPAMLLAGIHWLSSQ